MTRPIILICVIFLSSCKAYKQDILFQLNDNFTEGDLSKVVEEVESNYLLKPNDILLLDVFTNKGERLIDPNFELVQQQMAQVQQQRDIFQYVVQVDGNVVLPLVGAFNVLGMTLYEAELAIAEKFGEVYIEPFVKLRISNRRVIVLGAPGGQVVPLGNENMSVVEVVALAGGLELGAKSQNMKLIRNNEVFQIDLSTIEGYKASSMNVNPGDVIYIEPWRRPWLETLRDVSPALSIATSILTLVVVIQNLNQ